MLLETEMLLFDSDSDDELIILVAFAAMQEQERLNSERRSRSRSSRPRRKRPRPHRVIEEPPPDAIFVCRNELKPSLNCKEDKGKKSQLVEE
uniref:Uncharacterized protein n=1 Tax=Fagus sylvatica TaxID=28930 RepID=A0A2N9GV07_FAGSY